MSISSVRHQLKRGFTLIELIIVITILITLGVVIVALIDPAEILAQSRDSQRISDLATLKGASQLVLAAGVPSNYSTVCYNTAAPTGSNQPTANIYTTLMTAVGASGYGTTATSSAQLVDGNGWVRIDYRTPSTGKALTSLPLDPTNALSSGLYYRWGCNKFSSYLYEVDAALESEKYKPSCTATNCDDKASKDGGNSATRYEAGNTLDILPSTAATS